MELIVICPKCGAKMEHEVLCSLPAQHKYTCTMCKYTASVRERHQQSAIALKEALERVKGGKSLQ